MENNTVENNTVENNTVLTISIYLLLFIFLVMCCYYIYISGYFNNLFIGDKEILDEQVDSNQLVEDPTLIPEQELNLLQPEHNHDSTPLSEINVHENKEVFHVAGKRVPYKLAEKVCNQYNSELADYDQLLHSYQHGAEWCNYGWSKDQLGLYPTQKETWDKIQSAQPKHRNMCGHYGINGGKFNEKMKFGVNCYGVRPDKPNTKFVHPKLPKIIKETIEEKKKDKTITDLVVIPYNRVRWQRDLYPVS